MLSRPQTIAPPYGVLHGLAPLHHAAYRRDDWRILGERLGYSKSEPRKLSFPRVRNAELHPEQMLKVARIQYRTAVLSFLHPSFTRTDFLYPFYSCTDSAIC